MPFVRGRMGIAGMLALTLALGACGRESEGAQPKGGGPGGGGGGPGQRERQHPRDPHPATNERH